MPDDKKQKVLLQYPCNWVYKIIGTDIDEMQCAVEEIIRDRSYKISPSHTSTKSRYHCLNVEVLVESDSHRTAIYDALKTNPAVKVVL
jgi:putative lipoic acid-binding regulatory protein